MMNAPTSLPQLADRIRSAYARTDRAKNEWVQGTLELAAALAETRAQFPADQHFADWLKQNGLDYLAKNDRAALINMAADLDLARIVLQETQRHSWQHIWVEEMKPRFPHVRKPTDESTNSPHPPPVRPPAPAKPDYLTITAEEREQFKAEAERKQQAAAAAFEADQTARRMLEAQDEATSNYDALIAAWESCTEEEQLHFLRDFVGHERQDIG